MYIGVKTRRTGALLLAASVAFSSLLFVVKGQAQTPIGALNLTTSPLPISLKAKPGESVTTELRIRNSGNQTEKLKVGLMKFTASGEEGKPELHERGDGDAYFDWVKFSKTEFTAQPNEWESIKMTIDLPQSAAFGYYYAVTFSRSNADTADGDLQAAVRGGTATLVLLEADVPNAKRDLALESFTIGKRTYEFLPAKFNIKIQNKGNVHSAPTGTIFINRGGKQVAAIDVNATKGNILPDSKRVFSADWGEGFPAYQLKEENGKVVLKDGKEAYQLEWDASKLRNLRFGKYTATLVMVYDDGTRDVPMEATLSFWVVPWRLLIGGFLIILFAGIGIWVTVRKGVIRIRKKR